MGKIMSKLKKQFISNIPYYVLFFVLLFIHIQLNVSTGDDVNFAIRAKSMTFTDFNIYKYYNWSSRQLIESVLYFISVHSHVWMLLNSLVITIIAKLIEAIFCNHTIKMKILCCIGTLIYPLIDMSSAGWMATTINYYWPLGAILINLYYLKKANNFIKLKWYEYIISSIALLFAANQEQGFAILLGTYFFYIIYCFINKRKISFFVILNIVLIIASGTYIFTCPGNWVRKKQEVKNWFPDFGTLSFFRKIEIGISSTVYPILFKNNVPMLFLSSTLLIIINTFKNSLVKASTMIIFVMTLVFGVLGKYLVDLYPNISFLYSILGKYGILSLSNLKSFVPYIMFLIEFITLLIIILFLIKDNRKNIDIFIILLIGFGSRFMLCFSPTVWVSGNRTALFFYFSMIIASCLLISRYHHRIKNLDYFMAIFGVFAFCNIINCLV